MGLRKWNSIALSGVALVVVGPFFATRTQTQAFVVVVGPNRRSGAVFANSRATGPSHTGIPTSCSRASWAGQLTADHVRVSSQQTTELYVSTNTPENSSKDKEDATTTPTPSWALTVNPIFATAWVALVVFAFGLAPGELSDNSIVEQVMADPVHPGINEAYYTLFNIFVPLPIVLAALVLPQGQPRKGLPAGPFVAATTLLGFFTLGPYLSLRAPPRDNILPGDPISWVTRLLENKIFSWTTLALLLYMPFASGLLPDKWADPATWDGLWELLTTSRFASVSVIDLLLLHTSSAYLIAQDYRLRDGSVNGSSDDATAAAAAATKIAVAAFFFPFVGPALYCALRPQLPTLVDDANDRR